MKTWLIKWHDGFHLHSVKIEALDAVSAIQWTSHKYSVTQLISVELLPVEQT
jgi:hypothetical protein